jgi:hypothetical protein
VAIVLSILLRYTDSDYPFGIFWSLCCQFFFDIQILITPLVSCGHSMAKRYQRGNQNLYIEEELTTPWLKDIKGIIRISISKKNWQHDGQKIPKGYRDSDYPFGIFWPLCCQLFFDIQILITPLVSFGHRVVSSSSIYWLKNWQYNGQKIPKV